MLKPDLKRYPYRRNDTLQAWDAADELLLQALSELSLENKRVIVLNDSFGALSVGLLEMGADLTVYTDSYVSFRACELNTQGRAHPVTLLSEIVGVFDIALLRIPKNMSFFEDNLCHLSQHLHAGSKIICGYKVKHQANASFELLNKYVGETRTSLAEKKARLIYADFQRAATATPYPLHVPIEGFQRAFVNHSNLFSREKLDIGTRFLLEHIPSGDFKTILDLGCGNGIVGIAAKKANPGSKIIFSDESMMAIQSARANFQNHFPSGDAEFRWLNCYEGQEPASIDLAICNPPFHQGNTIGEHVAFQMFKDARQALKPGGVLRVIGNRHLEYPDALKRLFGNSRIMASNAKFVIVDAVNRT